MMEKICLAALVLVIGGCGSELGHGSVADSLEMSDSSPLVATVDGIPITRDEFQAYWGENPELSREEVMDWLTVRAHVQGRLAAKDDSIERPALRTARKRGAVRLFLEGEVEVSRAEANEIQLAEEKARLSVPAGFRVSHLVVTHPPDASSEVISKAKDVAASVIGRLSDDATSVDLAMSLPKVEPPLAVLVAPHMWFRAPGASGYQPDDWVSVDPNFATAVALMAKNEQRIGPDPVRSSQAWHVVILEEEAEGKVASDELVRYEADRRATAEVRYEKLQKILEEELPRTELALYPDALKDEAKE